MNADFPKRAIRRLSTEHVRTRPMLDKPDFPDEKIIACLQAEYGLRIAQVAFLPLGSDLSTAVYRAIANDEIAYFCKLKRGVFDDTYVEIPRLLSEQGIAQIIPPFATKTGQLRAALEEFNLIVYPFVEGQSGYDVELTNRQWADFGTALKRIHTTVVPPALTRNIQKETYAPEWRERCKQMVLLAQRRNRDRTKDARRSEERLSLLEAPGRSSSHDRFAAAVRTESSGEAWGDFLGVARFHR